MEQCLSNTFESFWALDDQALTRSGGAFSWAHSTSLSQLHRSLPDTTAHMLYGLAKNDPAKKALLREALRIYCKLDTLAMVVIWEHWRGAGRS